ncbi:MAG: hypothetical protein QOK11_2013 [Pseudonocardiales bacterium]|nr:hypothetical protein [Pseudonocardiales bacterium]
MSNWYPPPSRPRTVEGGIKARTARGVIGSSWWSRRFLDVLESFAMGSRLTRGRAYARKGQVVSLDVTPGEVRAAVQGSRVKPYQVRIGLVPFTELAWAKAEIAFSEQALPSAKLLAGEVPPELEQIFADAGAVLFPRTVQELDQRCSCPDWEVPCKHLAATFYLLAEAFDDDPFLLLRWRGRTRGQLLDRLRELRSESAAPAEREQPSAVAGAALALVGLADPTPDADRFWLPPPPMPPRPAVLDVDPGLVLRQLPSPGTVLGGEALVQRLRAAYETFAM